jgi:hypothetical protein
VFDGWRRNDGLQLCVDDIIEVLDEAPAALVVGTGYEGARALIPYGITLIAEKTSMVYKTFNTLVKIKRVVGAFYTTC